MATLFGMALGGWMSGAIFDLTGSYQAAFVNGILWNLVNLSIARGCCAAPRCAPPRLESLRGRGGDAPPVRRYASHAAHTHSEAVMATSRKRAAKRTRAGAGAARGGATAPRAESALEGVESALVGVARQVRSWSDSVLGIAGAAADVSIVAKAILVQPEQRAALEKAGTVLRGMREAAG